MTISLSTPLDLPCGAMLANRIGKAPMTEGLADANNHATEELVHLYRLWSEGGAGLLISGNVLVDRRYLERPANVAIEDRSGLEALKAYAAAGTSAGNHLWMQINHAGRQTPTYINKEPLAPSAVALELPGGYGTPRAMTSAEIEDVILRFALAAEVGGEAGFTGVQVHSAHGYLLSEFLSPKANQRTDEWGGTLENRARLLLEIVRAIRVACGPDFPISVKLNSADFQKGAFTHQDCLQVVQWLEAASVDLLEISGGTYEQPSMMGARAKDQLAENTVKPSTARREAYFLDYAKSMRAVTKIPLMVTGGFRTRAGMLDALESGDLDVVGIGRPMCVDTGLPARLLDGSLDEAGRYEASIVPPKAGLAWFCLQLIRIGRGEAPDTAMDGPTAIEAYKQSEIAAAKAMRA
ncbi:MAG TPA: NADH:flavin oxidoreductase/NADH oxidase family protein [Alphaproteobacteria bacterium]|nr:NADH:flavin oxidoreductase/NADH oxidase family protein [Alphaproteobacteria bacterium]